MAETHTDQGEGVDKWAAKIQELEVCARAIPERPKRTQGSNDVQGTANSDYHVANENVAVQVAGLLDELGPPAAENRKAYFVYFRTVTEIALAAAANRDIKADEVRVVMEDVAKAYPKGSILFTGSRLHGGIVSSVKIAIVGGEICVELTWDDQNGIRRAKTVPVVEMSREDRFVAGRIRVARFINRQIVLAPDEPWPPEPEERLVTMVALLPKMGLVPEQRISEEALTRFTTTLMNILSDPTRSIMPDDKHWAALRALAVDDERLEGLVNQLEIEILRNVLSLDTSGITEDIQLNLRLRALAILRLKGENFSEGFIPQLARLGVGTDTPPGF